MHSCHSAKSDLYEPVADAVQSARQLFVGFEQVKIERVDQFEDVEHNLLTALVRAKLDESSLEIAHYAAHQGECLVDVVMWTPSEGEGTGEAAPESEEPNATQSFFTFARDFANQVPEVLEKLQ